MTQEECSLVKTIGYILTYPHFSHVNKKIDKLNNYQELIKVHDSVAFNKRQVIYD